MKLSLLFLLVTVNVFAAPGRKDVIYGPDNRKDIYEVYNPLFKKLAASTAGMVDVRYFGKGSTATTFNFRVKNTLRESMNLCSGEKFGNQIVAPQCSGFLVGPDTLVTAGHCYFAKRKPTDPSPEQNCKNFAWVFDYNMKSPSTDPTINISRDNIYLCKSISSGTWGNGDYAVIKLDRPVVGREPLKFREGGKVSNYTSLVVIGHPTGLPTKITDGGKITHNTDPSAFATTLDTFHGNSGSAVFDARTGLVEGILIMGKTDYYPSNPKDPKSCQVSNRCDESAMNCSAGNEEGAIKSGEVVYRITKIVGQIKKALGPK